MKMYQTKFLWSGWGRNVLQFEILNLLRLRSKQAFHYLKLHRNMGDAEINSA